MRKITRIYKQILFNFRDKINLDELVLDEDYSLNEFFNYFGTDKGTDIFDPYINNSKKIKGHGFAKFYEKKLNKYRSKEFSILEIGTWEGASTASFQKFFPKSQLFALDKSFKFKFKSKRVEFINCNINNKENLNLFKKKFRNKKFTIIIDDGSHFLKDMITSLKFFLRYLNSSGIFNGDMSGSDITISGNVEGDINSDQYLIVNQSANIKGTIEYSSLQVSYGAKIQGTIRHRGSVHSYTPNSNPIEKEDKTEHHVNNQEENV